MVKKKKNPRCSKSVLSIRNHIYIVFIFLCFVVRNTTLLLDLKDKSSKITSLRTLVNIQDHLISHDKSSMIQSQQTVKFKTQAVKEWVEKKELGTSYESIMYL